MEQTEGRTEGDGLSYILDAYYHTRIIDIHRLVVVEP